MKRILPLIPIIFLAVSLRGSDPAEPIPVTNWKSSLLNQITSFMGDAGVKLKGTITMTARKVNENCRVIILKDSGNSDNTYNIGVYQVAMNSTLIEYERPIISFGGLTYTGVTDQIVLNTMGGDLSTIMDENADTGPFFVSPEGGRHNGLLYMYVDLTYAKPRPFNSISITPFFIQTGSDGAWANPAYQRLVVNRVKIDGRTVLEANSVRTNEFGAGPRQPIPPGAWNLSAQEISGWENPGMVFTHQQKKTFHLPKTAGQKAPTGTRLRIEMENPFRSDHDSGHGGDTFSMGIRELVVK